MKVLSVVGNRPQFVKAAAVSRHLRERLDEVLVHTGQHYDHQLSEVFFEELGIPEPEYRLETGSGSHAEQTAILLTALEPVVADEAPDAVLVYGDTNSTLAGALVAAKANLPLAHVEAGMRSGDRAMPEEVNRIVADRLSSLLLCSTLTAMENLAAEGMGGSSVEVGDVMADVAVAFGSIAERRSKVLEELGLAPCSYYVATAHRPGNVDSDARLALLVEVLNRAAERAPVIFSVHPRTRERLAESNLLGSLGPGVRALDPLGYLDFTKLVRGAQAVLTDSGGLQKEAYLAGVPCVTLRDTTEWRETIKSGWNKLVDLDADAAIKALDELCTRRRDVAPDPTVYGDGRAGLRVAEAVTAWLKS